MVRLALLRTDDPPDAFPDPALALREPDGLLAAGGDLTPARLLAAYRRGIFPWYEEGQPILWWSPDPRAVLLPDELHVSRSLRRRLRSDRYRISVDRAFARVIGLCASTRRGRGTWITPEMQSAYITLHRLGHAHAVETWLGTELVGGIYGVAMGRVFFGESMFSTERDASKVALVGLVDLLRRRGIELLDCQVDNAHLATLGSRTLTRSAFLGRLAALVDGPSGAHDWRREPMPTAPLLEPLPEVRLQA